MQQASLPTWQKKVTGKEKLLTLSLRGVNQDSRRSSEHLSILLAIHCIVTCARHCRKYIHTMATNSIKLLTGNSHPELAKLVADR